jgi:hypothetical protein
MNIRRKMKEVAMPVKINEALDTPRLEVLPGQISR